MGCADRNSSAPARAAIILVGNPNVGKSVIFSHLTGRYAEVSNYPGTTVEIYRGEYRRDRGKTVVDTPGVNSLQPQSLDEKVARDILLATSVEVAVQVADAKNLRRALSLTVQLAEMELPGVLVLNMMDEAKRRGIRISARALAERLGIPVVETVAVEGKGLRDLYDTLGASRRCAQVKAEYPEELERAIAEIGALLPPTIRGKRAIALMFLAHPEDAARDLAPLLGRGRAESAMRIAARVQERFSKPLAYIIGVTRSRAVDRLLDAVLMRDPSALGPGERARLRRTQLLALSSFALSLAAAYVFAGPARLGDWGLHPALAHLVVLGMLFSLLPAGALEKLTTHRVLGALFLLEVLYLLYSLVGIFTAGTLVDLIEKGLFGSLLIPRLAWAAGFLPWPVLRDLLFGDYGLVSMGLSYSLAVVLPIVAAFFFCFGLLEDSGYLPRLSVMADRAMRLMGLNGKAVLPMVLGLGCDTMATLTTRILDTRKERILATFLLALAIPCSAQLGVIMAVVSRTSLAVVMTVALVVVSQLVLVGSISSRLIRGRRTDFIVELPPLRVPRLANIGVKTIHRLKWFLMEAVPLFLLATLLLFVLDKTGGIGLLIRATRPVVAGLLGLPEQTTTAFVLGFFRRDYGAAGLYGLFSQGLLDYNQVAVSMVVITLFVPCLANFLVMARERGTKTALAMVAFILPYALTVGAVVNLLLSLTGWRL